MKSGKQLLKEALVGTTQDLLAARLGVSQETVSRWLSGEVTPTLGAAIIMRDRLKIPVEAWKQ